MISPDPDRASSDPQRVQLDYFAAHEPQRARGRGITFWSILLLTSWAPYICGIANAAAVAGSYVPHISSAHWNGAVLFMGGGLLMAAGCFARFVSLRHVVGSLASAVVMGMQLTIAMCLGLAH